jgi:hypothetical protein
MILQELRAVRPTENIISCFVDEESAVKINGKNWMHWVYKYGFDSEDYGEACHPGIWVRVASRRVSAENPHYRILDSLGLDCTGGGASQLAQVRLKRSQAAINTAEYLKRRFANLEGQEYVQSQLNLIAASFQNPEKYFELMMLEAQGRREYPFGEVSLDKAMRKEISVYVDPQVTFLAGLVATSGILN